MVEDVSVDQIKHSNAFDLKLPERSIDTTLIIGLSAAVCLILSALVLTGSLSAFYNIPAILLVFLGTFLLLTKSRHAFKFVIAFLTRLVTF